MRLGLVLAEIGERNNIKVTDEELTKRDRSSRRASSPARSRRSGTTTARIRSALAGLRAPIFEEKVVDFLLELAKVTEKKVSREELYKDDDERRRDNPARHGSNGFGSRTARLRSTDVLIA